MVQSMVAVGNTENLENIVRYYSVKMYFITL